MIGDSGVGKTSILSRFCGDTNFNHNLSSTIGVDCRINTIELNDKKFKLQIWDISGQERFRYIKETYYRLAQGYIIVFDLSDYETFLNVKYWINECSNTQFEKSGLIIPKIIVGNKNDIIKERQVSYEEVLEFAESQDIDYIETSAINNINIDNVFKKIIHKTKIKHIEYFSTMDKDYEKNNGTKKRDCCGTEYICTIL